MNPFVKNETNYSEYRLGSPSSKSKVGMFSQVPDLSSLEDGIYSAKYYGHTFELSDGRIFNVSLGGSRKKKTECRSFSKYKVSGGTVITFSGMSEMGGALQGMSYGKPTSSDPSEVTRLSVDANGFRIPSQIKQSFKLKTFSESDPRAQKGEFVGGVPTPTIPLKKDNMIMKDPRLNNKGPKNTGPGSLGPQPNVVNSMQLDWNTNAPFHLAVEPWITSPLMTPTDDGLYIGNLKGEQLNIGKTNLTLQVKLNTDYPESVVALIKNGKAMIFKTAQLVATTGSKVFSDISIYDKSFANPGVNTKGTYTFETKPSDKKLEMQAVIGTLVMSSAFIHLFHLCTQDYAIHMALEEYYRKMPQKVDDLAEVFLSNVPSANFQICVTPTSMDPAEYLDNLRQYLVNFQGAKLNNEPLYSSLLDDIIKLISTTMYKIRRLYSGGKIFSDITNYPNRSYASVQYDDDAILNTSKAANVISIKNTKDGEYFEYLDPKARYNYKDVRNSLIVHGLNLAANLLTSWIH